MQPGYFGDAGGPIMGQGITEVRTFQPHQQRVFDEKIELDKKISGLSAFMERPAIYGGLPELERMRLFAQRRVMVEYSNILGERIAAF